MFRLFTTTLLITALSATGALAGPPTKFIQDKVAAVRGLLAEKVTKGSPEAAARDVKLKAIIDPLMEFEKLSERALRKHWAGLKPEERARFIELFRELVFHSYLSKVSSANEAYTVEYEGEEPKPNQAAAVTAIAKTAQAEIELVFQLAGKPDRTFVAEDIVIDEVSLVDNYREQFNKIIATDGFPALLKKMEEKLEKLGAKPAAAPTPATPEAPVMKAAPKP